MPENFILWVLMHSYNFVNDAKLWFNYTKCKLDTSLHLQCCINFCCTAEWFSYTYIYILFYILFHYGLSQDIEYRSLCYIVGPCCLSILYDMLLKTNNFNTKLPYFYLIFNLRIGNFKNPKLHHLCNNWVWWSKKISHDMWQMCGF